MHIYIQKRRHSLPLRILSIVIVNTLTISLIFNPVISYAQPITLVVAELPNPGTMVLASEEFVPALIKGITIYPENPLEFDFIINNGNADLEGETLEKESIKLIKYFLASLTVPEDELWVNLSPYEEGRIISEKFGKTEMGRDLLAQDYMLKQLSASMMYPEQELGGKFWEDVYEETYDMFGTIDIPMNTFNKIWIIPQEAVVYQKDASAFVVKSSLKVMLEEDYVALKSNLDNEDYGTNLIDPSQINIISGVTSNVVKDVLIPAIEKEVNEGVNFANLRQIYNSMILAAWFKGNLKESLLGKVYVNKGKTKGVDIEDVSENQMIYEKYLEAFKKGVYSYIKEDYDPASQELVERRYFSGGYLTVNEEGKDLEANVKESGIDGNKPMTAAQQQIVEDSADDVPDSSETNIHKVNLLEQTPIII